MTRLKIDISKQYYLGSWRRSPFDATIMPQSLNIDEKNGKLALSSFDAPYNNLWAFHFTGVADTFVLALCNPSPRISPGGHSLYVGNDLIVSQDIAGAAIWELSPYEPFRNGPGDIAFQMRLLDRGRRVVASEEPLILCSVERSGKVNLMTEDEADRVFDKSGNTQVNIAWEATVDSDEGVGGDIKSVPDWLQEMLKA